MDGINPFDQFATDLKQAVPEAPAPAPVSQPPPPTQQQQPGQPPMMSMMMAPPPPQQQRQQQQPMYGQPPPPGAGAAPMYGAPPVQQQALVPSYAPPAPYGGYVQQQPMYGAPPPPAAAAPMSPYGGSVPSMPTSPPPAAAAANPFDMSSPPPPAVPAPVAPPVSMDPFGVAPPSVVSSPPPAAPAMPSADPFGAGPPAPVAAADPFGAPAAAAPVASGGSDLDALFGGALVPAAPVPVAATDPFGVPLAAAPPAAAPAPVTYEDPLAGFGDDFGMGALAAAPDGSAVVEQPSASGELPPGGEYYDAKIFTPTLGVMFFKPQELSDSLFLQTDKEIKDALGERPVVSFIVEGSSARSAGVELGHVLLKVSGVDVRNPKDASRLIKEGPRPLPLLFYVPNTTVVVAEGEHMVKYDTSQTSAPNSHKDWKPKYVVIGGIIAQPWMINMYRSKSEYDIAVIETQARRPVSVKVKQFSLQGARIQNDWQGPQMVKYKNQLHPWKFVVVLPVVGNPIKISSPNLSALKPVHEGIRRYLATQGGPPRHQNHHHAGPVRQAPPPPPQYGGYGNQQYGQPNPPADSDPYAAHGGYNGTQGGGGYSNDPYGGHGGQVGYDQGGGYGPPPTATSSNRRSQY